MRVKTLSYGLSERSRRKLPTADPASFLAELSRRRRGLILGVGVACVLVAAIVGTALYWEASEFFAGMLSGVAHTAAALLLGYVPAFVGAYFLTKVVGSTLALKKSDAWIAELVARGADRAALEDKTKHWYARAQACG